MNAQERYKRAQEAARNGRYEEALREHIWFHDHALEEQPALYGVRLSYALSDWLELAKVYPPALAALKSTRDGKAKRLLAGEGGRALFHDVVAINDTLADRQSTYSLFVALQQGNPKLTHACADITMPAIVAAQDFVLARALIGDPEEKLRKWASVLNSDIADLAKEPPREAPAREAYVHIYAGRVSLLLAILNGVGERTYAESLRERAVASVEATSVRDAVKAALSTIPASD